MKKSLHYHAIFIFCCFLCLFLSTACSPKYILQGHTIQGRAVDTDTGLPLTDAAVAIRRIAARNHRDPVKSITLKATQEVTNTEGHFRIPVFNDREFVMGVYKKGYVCWFNQENFLKNEGINEKNLGHVTINPTIKDGMEIRLTPFKNSYSQGRHAGFTVLVAGECTDTHTDPSTRPFDQNMKSGRRIFGKISKNSYETTRVRNSEPQNFEVRIRFAQSFLK